MVMGQLCCNPNSLALGKLRGMQLCAQSLWGFATQIPWGTPVYMEVSFISRSSDLTGPKHPAKALLITAAFTSA